MRVFNKVNRLVREPLLERDEHVTAVRVWISAEKRLGLAELLQVIAERLSRAVRRARIAVPMQAGSLRARLYSMGCVRGERVLDDDAIELDVELPDVELVRLAKTGGVRILSAPGMQMPCVPAERYLESAPLRAVKS